MRARAQTGEAENRRSKASPMDEIASICGSGRPISASLPRLTEVLGQLVPHDRILISLVRPVIGSTELLYQSGISVPTRPGGWNVPVVRNSLVRHVVRTRKPWVNSHLDKSVLKDFPGLKPSLEAGVKSWITVPLIFNDDCIGALQLQSLREGAYNATHRRLAEDAAAHMALMLSDQLAVERYRLETEVTTSTVEERAIVAELGHLVHSSPDLDEVYPQFVKRLRQLIPFDGVQISIRDSDTDQWKINYYQGPEPVGGLTKGGAQSDPTYTSFIFGQPSPFKVSVSTYEDIEALQARFPTLQKWTDIGLRSLLSSPLITRGEPVGVMHLWSKRSDVYFSSHAALAEQISIYVASAVNNAELTLRQRAQMEQRAIIAEIGNTVTSHLSIDDTFPQFAELMRKVVPWDRLLLQIFRPGDEEYTLRFLLGVGSKRRKAGDRIPLAGSFAEFVSRKREPVAIALDNEADRRMIEENGISGLKLAAEDGIRSFLAVPLLASDGLVGTLHAGSAEENAYSSEQRVAMSQVAAHLATAISNAELNARIERESEQKSIIARLGQILSSDVYLDNVLPEFHRELQKLLEADRLVVAYYNYETGLFEDRHVLGMSVPGWDGHDHTQKAMAVHAIVETKRGYLVPSSEIAEATPESQPGLAASYAAGLKSTMYAPLISGGRVIGSINLKTSRADAYTPHDLEMLERVALQVAGSVAAAESYQQAVIAAEDRERRVRAEAEKENLVAEASERSRFITQVGHELRTPLTTMLAFADILRRNNKLNLDDEQVEKLGVIQRNGRRLAALIDDMLDLSRIEIGDYDLIYAPVDASSVLRDVVEDFQPIVASRRQKLFLDAPEAPVMIECDPHRLAQVVSSLLSNASSYAPLESAIRVDIKPENGKAVISVSDEGPGVPIASQERVFDLFYRVDNEATRSVSGTGIGLYVAKTIVEGHGGTIRLDPSHRCGAKFLVEIPARAPIETAGDENAA